MPHHAVHTYRPKTHNTCVVFASPHSGRDYTGHFLRQSVLDHHAIRSSEDAYVDDLFMSAPDHGAPLVTGGMPRAYVDLNRSEDELDPALIEGVRRSGHNPRVASGLGVIPRVVANGRAIYSGKIPLSEATRRIETYWRPYHARLRNELSKAQQKFGQAILVDCHSMPREAMDSVARTGAPRPDVVIGDRFGAAASDLIVSGIEDALHDAGLTVVRNTPFAGAYITQHYGRPSSGIHAIQIEIDRSLYMNERQIRPHEGFDAFRRLIDGFIAKVADLGRPLDQSLAAE